VAQVERSVVDVITYDSHQRRAHLVDPDVVAVGAEAVHDDSCRARRVERVRRPAPRRGHVAC
jgi:hypothetical protein